MYGTKERWWPAAKSQAKDIAQVGPKQAELDAIRLENERLLQAEKNRSRLTADELAAERAAKQALENQSTEEAAKLAAIAETERLAAQAAREAERLKSQEVEGLSADLANSQARIQELETAAQRRVRLAQKESQSAALAEIDSDIERLLRALDEGNLVNAEAVTEELSGNALVQAAPLSLIPFLSQLVAGHRTLEQLETASDPFEQYALLPRADAAIGLAGEAGKPVMTGDNDSLLLDGPGRIGIFQAHLDSMKQRVDSSRLAVGERFDVLWGELLANPDRTPAEVLPLIEVHGAASEALAEYLGALDQYIDQNVLNEGALDLERLRQFRALDAWSQQLEASPVAGLGAQGLRLQNLRLAREFYSGNVPSQVPVSLDETDSGEPWLTRLNLEVRLLEPARGMRAAIGTRLLYHTTTAAGEESWRWDTVLADLAPPSGVDDSRLILQEFHDQAGNKQGERTVRLQRIGLRLYEGDTRPVELFNLALDGPSYAMQPWQAAEAELPPAKLLVPPGAFADFRKRLVDEEWLGLNVDAGRQTSLWTRELGLVRHRIPGRISYELVYAELP